MGIHIDDRIALTRTQKKVIRAAVVTGSVIAALGVGLAIAAPHQWKASDPLAAADLNGLNVLTYTSDAGTVSYSVGPTKFCGSTPFTTAGTIDYAGLKGYAAAKKACETVPSCGNSVTAHMCTSEELVRTAQLGAPTESGWQSSGTVDVHTGGTIADCWGWTQSQASLMGLTWNPPPAPMPNGGPCSDLHPILCCD